MPSEQSSRTRKILHKRSNQSGRIPSLSALDLGELAINTYDGALYTKVLRGGEESVIDLLADNSSYFSAFSVNYALSSIAPSVGGNVVEGIISNILGGYGNLVTGSGSTALGGENNRVDGDFSLSFGLDNDTQGHNNTILLGSGLSANADNYTYINNLSTAGNVEAGQVITNNIILNGNITASGGVSAVGFFGDGNHLKNLPNLFDQTLNTTNNVSFSSLNLTNTLTAKDTTIQGNLSASGRIYASDIHAPLSVTDLITTTKTLALSDVNSIITGNNGADIDIYIPADSEVNLPIGTEIKFIQLGTKKMHINANAGVDLANSSNQFKTKGQHAVTWLFKVAANQWIFAGDTSA